MTTEISVLKMRAEAEQALRNARARYRIAKDCEKVFALFDGKQLNRRIATAIKEIEVNAAIHYDTCGELQIWGGQTTLEYNARVNIHLQCDPETGRFSMERTMAHYSMLNLLKEHERAVDIEKGIQNIYPLVEEYNAAVRDLEAKRVAFGELRYMVPCR